ncbi:ATP-dependent helicase [Mucispirillum schaedleri]|uniref:ATP-dependent helicase n=1 Tax=Mucispirillum schaedleri TaxID=248039 RepID=UPI0024BFE8ED|nr:UvrD-helicase domain-containing protein [Mucispirillum schaedleri]
MDEALNERQAEAVKTTEGPVLVLAGAGTGKTRVITYRIAHLIVNKEVSAGNILAVTFTNKAAGEMKSRLHELIGGLANGVWMGTFHSICLGILRNETEYAGLPKSFSIVDQEDRLAIIRQIIKSLNIDPKQFSPKSYLQAISSYKNTENYVKNEPIEETFHLLKTVYETYKRELELQRLVDFDDMIALCVRIFANYPDILKKYQDIYKYILVDEYQDTNAVQFRLLYMLAGISGNLCVVGDDDQSIYGWRGAEVRNILEFDKVFENVKEIKLEGNYRSGKSILSIANRLIENNTYRRGKTLEASADKQSEVKKYEFYNDLEEASFTAKTILDKHDDGISYDDMAILYRTNAQSLNFERALKMANIPHKVIGNIGFYQRREVKDILAYLKFSDNPKDEQAFFRSISVPKRGIGNSTNDKIISYAEENDITILETLETDLKFLSKSRAAVDRYIQLIHDIIKCESIRDKIELILNTIKYKEYLQSLGEEPDIIDRKMENIDELISDAVRFEEQNGSSLSDFLASAALVSSNDEEDIEGSVKLMTMHAAKGLEFKLVFLTGLEEGLFPLGNEDGEANIEEERRLCYVGVTRAMETLYITRARSRIRGGRHNQSPESRFLSELQFGRSFKFNKGSTNNTFKNRSGNYADYIKNSSNYEKKEYNDDNTASFKASSKVYHSVFGEGTVLFSEGSGENEKVTVHFKKEGVKKIIANFLEKA